MHSFKTTLAVAATLLISLAQTQYTIDPNEVPIKTREGWCNQQISLCPALCTQVTPDQSTNTDENSCDPTTLTYSCICSTGHITPNASQYSQTLPFFICQQYDADCITACNGDNVCQGACRADHPCGAQNPVRINVTSTSTSTATATGSGDASSTTGAGVVYNGLGATAAVTSSSSGNKSGAQSTLDMGRVYGLGAVTAGLFVGFAFMI